MSEYCSFSNYVKVFPGHLKRNEEVIIFFHGFPGEKNNGSPLEKNQDLAQKLCEDTGLDVYLPHYNGLGKNSENEFSFTDSIIDSLSICHEISKKYHQLIIVGHSWGGQVALNCYKTFSNKISKMLLMSPLIIIPANEVFSESIKELLPELPINSRNKSIEKYLEEIDLIRNIHSVGKLKDHDSTPVRIIIIQASNDSTILPKSNENYATENSPLIEFETFETDHGFIQNRREFYHSLLEHLK